MSNGLAIDTRDEVFDPDSYDKANIVELIFRVMELTGIEGKNLADKLLEGWKDDIFMCESCGHVYAWEDSVKIPGAIVDGKIHDPGDTVCKHCK